METHNDQAVQVTPSLRIEWTPIHDLFISQITDVAASTIDSWYTTNVNVINKWPEDEPLRALLDFAYDDHIYVTPRAKAYAERLFRLRPGLKGRVALLIRPSISAQSIQLFAHRHTNSAVMGAVFFDRDKALAWLQEA